MVKQNVIIKNIYYMLTYAFRVLKQTNYEEIASEEFENIEDLLSAIISKGINKQLKQGLYREYIPRYEDLSVMHGKININGTIENKIQRKQVLACEFDELSENNIFNQILKTTSTILMRQKSVSKKNKTDLKKVMLYFGNVDTINTKDINWNILSFHRSNQNYKMLLNICYFVLDGLLLSTEEGEYKVSTFLDDQKMHALYEKFVLEYYKYHYPKLRVSASQIKWIIDDGVIDFLPNMQTDITIRNKEKVLIIDTKYYSKTMQGQYDRKTMHSNNLYQIFAYVKNYDVLRSGNISGMLLYAKTNEDITPDQEYRMSGNNISVKTLDLNVSFSSLSKQLDKLLYINLGEVGSKKV